MINEAFKAIQTTLKTAFPGVQVLLNWPESKLKAVYPQLVMITVRQDNIYYPQNFIEERVKTDGSKVQVLQVGEWRSSIDLNYFAKSLSDQSLFLKKFLDFFRTGAKDNLANRSKNISSGAKSYQNLNFTLLDYTLDQQSFSLQTGSGRQTIFSCRADIPDLVEDEVPLMTNLRLSDDSIVTEKAFP